MVYLRSSSVSKVSIIAAAALALSLLVATPSQANGCVGFAGGSGTSGDPYLVADRSNLEALDACRDAGKHFLQVADIDLGGSAAPWVPMSDASPHFAGTYNGDNYEIQNLYVSVAGDAGLFSKTEAAAFRNLRFAGASVTSQSSYAGALAGMAQATAISNSMVQGDITGGFRVGGFAGVFFGARAQLSKLYADVNVRATGTSGHAGAIAGMVENSSAALSDIFVRGTVHSAGQAAGGVIGWSNGNNTITRAVSLATVTGGTSYRGGIAGAVVLVAGASGISNSFHLNTGVTELGMNFSTARTAEQLKEAATYSGASFDIGQAADSASVWRILADVNDGYPFLSFTTLSAGCAGFAGGNGTSGNPYQVTNRAGLEALANCLDGGRHFVQTAHIDLGGSETPWTPLGTSVGFAGSFDGNSFEIQNLNVNVSGLAGLFARLAGATLTNVRVVGADVTSTANDAGIIAGFATGSTIEDSSVNGSVKGRGTTGGLIGMTQSTRSFISRVSADVSVDSEFGNAGGIVGQVEFLSATLTDVLAMGTVNSVGGQMSGGIVGYGIAPTINRAVSLANVTGATANRGGVIGNLVNDASVLTNSLFLDSAVTQLNSNFAVAKTEAELKTIATFSGATFDIGTEAESATTWRLLDAVNDGFPHLTATSFTQPPAAQTDPVVAPVTYDGPVLEVSNRLVRPGETVTISGSRLESVTAVMVGGAAASVGRVSDTEIEFSLPTGLASGSHDITLQSSFGRVTIQSALMVRVEALIASPRVVLRQMSDSTVKLYVFDLVGAGKVTLEIGDSELAWVNAVAAGDSKLRVTAEGVPYLVRTLSAEQLVGLSVEANGTALSMPELSR